MLVAWSAIGLGQKFVSSQLDIQENEKKKKKAKEKGRIENKHHIREKESCRELVLGFFVNLTCRRSRQTASDNVLVATDTHAHL